MSDTPKKPADANADKNTNANADDISDATFVEIGGDEIKSVEIKSATSNAKTKAIDPETNPKTIEPETEVIKPEAIEASSDDADAKNTEPLGNPPVVVVPRNTAASDKKLWILGLLMLVGWGATGAAAYWVYQQQFGATDALENNLAQMQIQLQQTLAQSKTEQTQVLEDFRQKVITELTNIEHTASTEANKLSQQFNDHELRLNGMQERLAALSTTSREDWLLAEAEYLLRIANQRVLLEGTPDNVVPLLVRADAIVERASKGLGDRELLAIRRLLADEITALKLLAPVDTQGVYLALESLAQNIHNLPTLPLREERFTQATTPEADNQSDTDQSTYVSPNPSWLTQFKTEMANVFAFLRSSFSIKSEQELANPIVSQQRLQLMQLNTRLLIEQAQIALLKQNTTSYQASLKAASELTTQYYFDSPARNAFAQQLNDLAAQDIAPTLPDIGGSLKLLHTYIAEQHRLNAPTAGNYEGAQ